MVRPGRRARRLAADASRREHDGTDLVLRGEVRPVESAGTAAHLLVTCGDGGGTTQVLVPTSATGVTVSPMQTVDLTRRFSRRRLRRRAGPRRRGGRGDGEGVGGRRPSVPGVPGHAQRGVGRGHADRIRHDRRVGVRPLLLRAAARLVPGPEAPVRRHDELARGLPCHQRGGLRRRTGAQRRRTRAGQRRQGLHRPVRRRAPAGLRAAARGHRGHVRARPAPVPASRHRRQSTGRDTGGPPPAHRRHGGRAAKGRRRERPAGGAIRGRRRHGGPRDASGTGPGPSSGPTSDRSRPRSCASATAG